MSMAANAIDILIVEDDASIGDVLRDVLEERGYRVLLAENGRVALERLRHCTPRLVLLDLAMPVMDGWECRRALQRDPALARVPVVVLSAEQGLEQGLAALAVHGFLAKPFALGSLLATVSRFCAPPRDAGAPDLHAV